MLETEKSLNKMINVFNEIANLYILDIAKICNCLIFFYIYSFSLNQRFERPILINVYLRSPISKCIYVALGNIKYNVITK